MKMIILSLFLGIIAFIVLLMFACYLFVTDATMADKRNDYASKLKPQINSEFEKYNMHVTGVAVIYKHIRLHVSIYVDHFTELPPLVDQYVAEHKLGFMQKLSIYEEEPNTEIRKEVFSKTYCLKFLDERNREKPNSKIEP